MKTMGGSPWPKIFWTAPLGFFPTIEGERYSVIGGECKANLREFQFKPQDKRNEPQERCAYA
jgi:hypothetical protein